MKNSGFIYLYFNAPTNLIFVAIVFPKKKKLYISELKLQSKTGLQTSNRLHSSYMYLTMRNFFCAIF